MPKALGLGDILTVSIFIGGCVFSFTELVCAAILRHYIPTLHRGNAKWRHTQAWRMKKTSSDKNTYDQNIA